VSTFVNEIARGYRPSTLEFFGLALTIAALVANNALTRRPQPRPATGETAAGLGAGESGLRRSKSSGHACVVGRPVAAVPSGGAAGPSSHQLSRAKAREELVVLSVLDERRQQQRRTA
jgi:hypothetical protein